MYGRVVLRPGKAALACCVVRDPEGAQGKWSRPAISTGPTLTHLARSAAGVKVVSALRISDGSWPADADRLSHFAQVVVQLMIPPRQLVHLRPRDRQGK